MQGPGRLLPDSAAEPFPSVSTVCLAPGPGLRSPHSSLLSTQQNRLSKGRWFHLRKCPRTSQRLQPCTSAAISLTGLRPHPAQPFFSVCVLPSCKRPCVWSGQLLSCSAKPFACAILLTSFISLCCSFTPFNKGWYCPPDYLEGRLGKTAGDTASSTSFPMPSSVSAVGPLSPSPPPRPSSRQGHYCQSK